MVVERAKDMESDIKIAGNGKVANAKSILSVLALGAVTGDVVTITASGEDAAEAIARIAEIVTATEEEL